MPRVILILCALALILLSSTPVYAATYTFLDDYDVTWDGINDVIHLGDNGVASFIKRDPDSIEITFNFDLPAMPADGRIFTICIDHYDSDTNGGNYNHLYLNDVDLGYLSESPSSQSVGHWLTEQFTDNNDILSLNDNTLRIVADIIGTNRDDFEFTNLYLDYTAVPIPAAFWFLGSGLIGLMGIRRRFNKA